MDVVAGLPVDSAVFAAVVNRFGSRCCGMLDGSNERSEPHTSVQIKHDLQSSCSCPSDSLVEVCELSLNIWVSRLRIDSPVSDWNTSMIQPEGSDLLEISLCDLCCPMLGCRCIRPPLLRRLPID